MVRADASLVTQQCNRGSQSLGDGRASVPIFGSSRPTSVEGLVQTWLLILLTLPDAVPLARPHLYRRTGIKQSLALAAILAQQSWRVGVFKALQVKRAPQSWSPSPLRGPTSQLSPQFQTRPCFEHHARDDPNADELDGGKPPQVVVQYPGWDLVGRGDRGQLTRALLEEANCLAELARVTPTTFHATFHLQQPALHARPDDPALWMQTRRLPSREQVSGGRSGAGLSRPPPARASQILRTRILT